MAYCIMKTKKLKAPTDITKRYMHDLRISDPENADGSLSYLNQEMIPLEGRTYNDLYQETLDELMRIGSQRFKPRSTANREIDILLDYSSDMRDMDVDAWIEANMEWLDRSFNPPEHLISFVDKETGLIREERVQNVKSAIVHYDETVPHIHAIVVPVSDKGQINCSYYLDGRDKIMALYESYYQAMKPLGLERGNYNSVATPDDLKTFRRELVKAVHAELPAPTHNEDVHHYHERASKFYVTEMCHHRNDVMELDKKIVRQDAFIATVGKELGVYEMDEVGHERCVKLRDALKSQSELDRALKTYPDQDFANQIRENMNDVLIWQRMMDRDDEEPEKKTKDRDLEPVLAV